MDYKLLLIKYINHVGETEGVTFISERCLGSGRPPDGKRLTITPEDVKELEALNEITSQYWQEDRVRGSLKFNKGEYY